MGLIWTELFNEMIRLQIRPITHFDKVPITKPAHTPISSDKKRNYNIGCDVRSSSLTDTNLALCSAKTLTALIAFIVSSSLANIARESPALAMYNPSLNIIPTKQHDPTKAIRGPRPQPSPRRDHNRATADTTAETVFRSLCKKSGKETIIRLGLPEMKKVICERPESDMQQEFPRWFESNIGNLYTSNDPRCTPDLFALACGPSLTATSINSCVVNGVKFVVHSRDVKRTTQNSGICSPCEKPGEMYYGQLDDILGFRIPSSKLCCFELSGST
ncbi:hypothetical protein CTI12_AA058620 [Artemisia annua]|uniref:Uncharacterized protein n=1 Tax=Artemisia annua TaxID=35608 RepID=A0A2U1Q9C2_ARTAN|nr:hypothetical protein CTI12_AA058620 [Artemisia annua]